MKSWGQKPVGNGKKIQDSLAFERALHRWDKWLDSIDRGHKALLSGNQRPSLKDMKKAAKKAISEMEFGSCKIFEVYWLCCVFADYGSTKTGFEFGKLILPDWFPLPYGFVEEYQLKNVRIYPPEVWTEAERMFWFKRALDPLGVPEEERTKHLKYYPDKELNLVLPKDHPVRKHFQKGRPEKPDSHGSVFL